MAKSLKYTLGAFTATTALTVGVGWYCCVNMPAMVPYCISRLAVKTLHFTIQRQLEENGNLSDIQRNMLIALDVASHAFAFLYLYPITTAGYAPTGFKGMSNAYNKTFESMKIYSSNDSYLSIPFLGYTDNTSGSPGNTVPMFHMMLIDRTISEAARLLSGQYYNLNRIQVFDYKILTPSAHMNGGDPITEKMVKYGAELMLCNGFAVMTQDPSRIIADVMLGDGGSYFENTAIIGRYIVPKATALGAGF